METPRLKTKMVKAEPFTVAEDKRLMNLVMKFQSIIECKQTDHVNNIKKHETWKKIEHLFNQAQEGLPYRTHNNLKNRYTNKKTRGKKEIAEKKMRSYFSPEETSRFINLLEELQTTNLTDSLWEDIVEKFNHDECTLPRTRLELKQLFDQLSLDTKKKLKMDEKQVTDTGGGKYIPTHYSQEEEQLTALLKNRMVGDEPIYDNDNDQLQDCTLHGYAEQSVDDFEGSYVIETVTLEDDIEYNRGMQSIQSTSTANIIPTKNTNRAFSTTDTNNLVISAEIHDEMNGREPQLDITSNLDKKASTSTFSFSTAPNDTSMKKNKPIFSLTDRNNARETSNKNKIHKIPEGTTKWEKNTTAFLTNRKSACLTTASEPSEETKRHREYKTKLSEWAKSKIQLNTLHYDGVQESILKRKEREEQEFISKQQKANELHNIKVKTETELGKLQVEEVKLRMEHLIAKQKLELEILNLEKSAKLKALGLMGTK